MGNFTSYTQFINRVTAPDATTVKMYCSKPKANMLVPGDPDPARAHLEQGLVQGGGRERSRTTRRSSAPARSRWSSARRTSTCASSPTRTTGAAPPRSTRSSSRTTRTRTRWRRTSRPGTCRPRSDIPQAQFGAARQGAADLDQGRQPRASTSSPSTATRGRRSATACSPIPKFRQALNWAVDTAARSATSPTTASRRRARA